MHDQPLQIGFIGTGTMGGMLIHALVQRGSIAPENIWAANRTALKLERLAAEIHDLHCADSHSVAAASEILFLCVKPADTQNVLQQIQKDLRTDQICVLLTNIFPVEQIELGLPSSSLS